MSARPVHVPFDIPASVTGDHVVFLNSNGAGENFLAIGCRDALVIEAGDERALSKVSAFLKSHEQDWIMGYFSYDLRHAMEDLSGMAVPSYPHPWVHLFVPERVMRYRDGQGQVWGNMDSPEQMAIRLPKEHGAVLPLPRISREEYISRVSSLRSHIQRGDIYEVNFCQEFTSHSPQLDPWSLYLNLNGRSLAPMSVFASMGDLSIMSASPERYLSKKGGRIISQPIKGTIRRGEGSDDEALKAELASSDKERAENVMIVDLVRNDLSRIAARGTVRVDELFGIHTFRTVHHMISTISCEPAQGVSFTDILKATYPMGSMTGAPKISAMNLIDSHEAGSRGLYSGAFGYIAPGGDFDFNVMIRTYVWHRPTGLLSCHAGGAITALSEPVKEYEESLLKVDALLRAVVG